MKITINNIAKIYEACVELNGVTVIAGENNTGKSTVGKALFSVFNSFYSIENQIFEERVSAIENIIDNFYIGNRGRIGIPDSFEFGKTLVEKYNGISTDVNDLKNDLTDFLFHNPSSSKNDTIKSDIEKVDEIASKIFDVINIPDFQILKNIISKKLNTEFNNQINNIYNGEKGYICLEIKDESVNVCVHDNEIQEVSDMYNLKTEVVYIDDPFVLDDNRPRIFLSRSMNYMDHKAHLRNKLYVSYRNKNIVDEIITSNKLQNIYSKINNVCQGEVVTTKRNVLGYKKFNSEKVLNINNISTGLKTFVILKSLLENGTLENNGTIILDEPEIHLHPQWQLILAELIILLQKEFGLHILLNTHSPYFMKAIEVFSSKYEIADKCKYYLAKPDGENSTIHDVTDKTEEIYKLLAKPLQDLENVRFDND